MSLFKLIRWKSWSDTKLVFLFMALGIVILNSDTYSLIQQLKLLSKFTLLFIFYGSFVSIANDYWDLEIDKEAKKDRSVAQSSKLKIYLILTFFLSGFFAILMYNSKLFFPSVFAGAGLIMLGFFYSNPIIRFKERGVLGLIVGSLIQRTFPLLLVFYLLNYFNTTVLLYIIISFVLGLMMMLLHQMEDYYSDLQSGVKTVVTKVGLKNGKKIVNTLYLIFGLFLVLLILSVKEVFLLFIVYTIFWVLVVIMKPTVISKVNLYSLNNYFLSDLLYVWFPIYIGLMVWFRTKNPLLFIIFIFLQKKHIRIFTDKIFN